MLQDFLSLVLCYSMELMNSVRNAGGTGEHIDPSPPKEVGGSALANFEFSQHHQEEDEDPVAIFLKKFPEFEGVFGKKDWGSGDISLFDLMDDPKAFQLRWKALYDRVALLGKRKLWVQMKEKGGKFTDALEAMTLASLDASGFEDRLYHLIRIYHSLGAPGGAEFYGKLLSHKSVYGLKDGSTVDRLLGYLGDSRDPSTTTVLFSHIEHILSPEYARIQHRSSDLGDAVRALQKVLGKGMTPALDAYAEQSSSFAEWWEKKKVGLWAQLADKTAADTAATVPPPFDLAEEKKYLEELEEDLKAHPYEKSTHMHSGMHDEWDQLSPYDDPFDETSHDHSSEHDETVEEDEQKERQPYRKRTINFYGRFRPHVEHPVVLTEKNLLGALCGLAKGGKGGPEEYLRLLSGFVEENELSDQVPEVLSVVELRSVAMAAYARIAILATVEHNINQAKQEFDEVEKFFNHVNAPPQELSRWQISFLTLRDALGRIAQEENVPTLPNSALPFFVYHQKFEKMREIPPFTELLAEKIRYMTALGLAGQTGADWSVEGLPGEYERQLKLYASIEAEDVPVYWEAKERLDDAGANRCVVFGRDGKYLFTALKAGDFGHGERELKYVLVTRGIESYETGEAVATYLKQQGVELDSHFVDTGYAGSIPEFAIRSLATAGGVEISSEEIDRRIKLIISRTFGRQSIAAQEERRKGDPVQRIEDRPLSIESPSNYEITPEGKLVPEEKPMPASTQLSAWVVEHAVMRNFAPRFEPERRLRTPSSMEGYRFLERFFGGAVVSTHPLELWEDPDGKKVLLKGGSEHTLRADYVGSRLFEKMGIQAPKTDLLRTEEGLKLKMEYLDGWEDGPIMLPERLHNSEKIQKGFFVDLLLQQYDRTSWNMMFKENEVAFIDHGAGLHSRARGGYKGFLAEISLDDIAFVLEHPERPGKVVNEAYGALIEVESRESVDSEGRTVVNKKLIIKNRQRVQDLLYDFHLRLGGQFFNTVVDEAGFSDGRRALEELRRTLEKLKKEFPSLSPDSRDARQHQGAIETIGQMITMGGESLYLKKALKQRYTGIVDLFERALLLAGQANIGQG